MSLGPPDAPLGEELVRLASADNFRDLTGPGHRTADGRALRPGLVYRSNELALTDDDAARVADLGVTTILDLRHADEIARPCGRRRAGRGVGAPGDPRNPDGGGGHPGRRVAGRGGDARGLRGLRPAPGRPGRVRCADRAARHRGGAAGVPLHRRQGPHRLGGGAGPRHLRRPRRRGARRLPRDQPDLEPDPGEVPRDGARAPGRRQGRGLRAGDGRRRALPHRCLRRGDGRLRLARAAISTPAWGSPTPPSTRCGPGWSNRGVDAVRCGLRGGPPDRFPAPARPRAGVVRRPDRHRPWPDQLPAPHRGRHAAAARRRDRAAGARRRRGLGVDDGAARPPGGAVR